MPPPAVSGVQACVLDEDRSGILPGPSASAWPPAAIAAAERRTDHVALSRSRLQTDVNAKNGTICSSGGRARPLPFEARPAGASLPLLARVEPDLVAIDCSTIPQTLRLRRDTSPCIVHATNFPTARQPTFAGDGRCCSQHKSDASCAGLTRASIKKESHSKGMDCRVKPGNDPNRPSVTQRTHPKSVGSNESVSRRKYVRTLFLYFSILERGPYCERKNRFHFDLLSPRECLLGPWKDSFGATE